MFMLKGMVSFKALIMKNFLKLKKLRFFVVLGNSGGTVSLVAAILG